MAREALFPAAAECSNKLHRRVNPVSRFSSRARGIIFLQDLFKLCSAHDEEISNQYRAILHYVIEQKCSLTLFLTQTPLSTLVGLFHHSVHKFSKKR